MNQNFQRTTQSNKRVPAAKNVLIILENQGFYVDTRVKKEAVTLRDAGWDVHVVCPRVHMPINGGLIVAQDLRVDSDNIHVHDYSIRMANEGNLSTLREYLVSSCQILRIAWRLWREHRFSVIHLCNPPDFLFAFALVFKMLGSKIVFDHHDLFPEMILIRLRRIYRTIGYQLARLIEYITFRVADIVISTNQSYREIAIQRGKVKPEAVYVVRNGPSLSSFLPVEPDLELKRGFPYMASYAGVMNKEDGVLELIEVIRHIVKDIGREDIFFYLLGDGRMYDRVIQEVERFQLSKYVCLPGMIFDNLLFRKILSTSEVLLAPELSNPLNDKSTFMKIAEYMAMGRPIIAYDLKETRHTAGDSALYAGTGDAKTYAKLILELLSDPARSKEMGMRGQARIAQELSWESQQKTLLAAYEAVRRN